MNQYQKETIAIKTPNGRALIDREEYDLNPEAYELYTEAEEKPKATPKAAKPKITDLLLEK